MSQLSLLNSDLIFVPEQETEPICVYFQNSEVIYAVYPKDSPFNTGTTNNYPLVRYSGEHYAPTLSTLSTLPTACINSDYITHEVWYRRDFDRILVIFCLLCIIFFWFPLKILRRLFRRW